MPNELYELLDVEATATENEIKRGYFKQVRKHPPEKEPEKFKLIRSAYETLSNKTTRSNYDALQNFGGEIQTLTEEAESLMEKENWSEAVKCWKRILVLAPDSDAARSSLAMSFLLMGRIEDSIKTYRQLTTKNGSVPTFWMGLGWAYSAKANNSSEAEEAESFQKAEQAFQKVIAIEPYNSSAHQAIATLKRNQDDWSAAAKWYESAVGADDKLDIADFDPLYELCFVYIVLDNTNELRNALDRIGSITPEEQDAKEFVAGKLCYMAATIAEKWNRYKEAAILFKQATKLWPDNAEIKNAQKESQTIWKASEEHEKLEHDSYVIPPLRVLVAIPLAQSHGEDVEENLFGNIMEALGTYTVQDVRDSLARLKSSYPSLYKMSKEILTHIQSVINGESQQQRRSPSHSAASSNRVQCNRCGASILRSTYNDTGGLCMPCYKGDRSTTPSSSTSNSSDCFIVTATIGVGRVEVIDHYRDFRDHFLLNHAWGREFVRAYYRIGPCMARWIRARETVKLVLSLLFRFLWRILPGTNRASRQSVEAPQGIKRNGQDYLEPVNRVNHR